MHTKLSGSDKTICNFGSKFLYCNRLISASKEADGWSIGFVIELQTINVNSYHQSQYIGQIIIKKLLVPALKMDRDPFEFILLVEQFVSHSKILLVVEWLTLWVVSQLCLLGRTFNFQGRMS